jgi:iron complex outermembrane receptor protein
MILDGGTCEGVIVRSSRARVWLVLAAVMLLMASFSDGRPAFAGDLDRVASFDIPAQPLDKALLEFGDQAHVQIMFSPSSSTHRLRTRALKGRYTSRDALAELLRGTGLNYSERGHTIAVAPLQSSSAGALQAAAGDADPPSPTRPDRAKTAGAAKAGKSGKYAELQEITVTGTHIRSAEESVLPTQTFTREDIDESGVGTLAAFLETLPENSASGMSETTNAAVAGGGQSAANATAGTGVNLRGVGNDATLVLIDGHRVAPAALFGDFVDLSMIPLAAVERIDVVTDGASAIYGSDAVGGVVNIVTRHRFNGIETRARFGSDDHNDIHEGEIGQTIGRAWASGAALLTYEFYDRTPLNAADRSFTASAPQPFTLLPEQVRQSAFAGVNQSVGENLWLYSDGYFSHRSTDSYATILGSFQEGFSATVDSYGAILGASLAITDTTQFDVSGNYSVGDTNVGALSYPQTSPVQNQKGKSEIATGDAVLNGKLWNMPAGPLLYAVGAQYRDEAFVFQDFIALTAFKPSRHVAAGFAELRIPILGYSGPSGVRHTLELNLADREERYSDAGSTNNKSIGVVWKPMVPLELKGTYGTSFVAPLLNDTNPVPSEVVGFNTSQVPGSAPPGSGTVNELIVFGGSADLRPQTATT